MHDRRNARRRGRPHSKPDDEDVKPRRGAGRRRSRPAKSEDLEFVEEQEIDAQEEIIESGKAPGSDIDEPSKRNGKRKRSNATSKTGVRTTEPFSYFEGLLLDLWAKEDCEAFLRPVLTMWNEDDVPGYLDRIKRPMDLGTIKRNLKSDKYIKHTDDSSEFWFDEESFLVDVRLVFENCMAYNEPGSDLYKVAADCIRDINEQVSERDARKVRQQEKVKRENERKKRKAAEEQAEIAEITAQKAADALRKAKQQAEEIDRRRQIEFQRREQEFRRRMEEEKSVAVAMAVKEALDKQRRDHGSHRAAKMVNTSSVSSDEHEGTGEVTFTFVSTKGMEKKRGRKSGVVMELEAQHDELMKKRKVMVETAMELESQKQVEMTFEEKKKLCDQVSELDFVRMKAVVDILSRGLNRPDIINEVEIDLDVDHIDNKVLREIQYFLKSPAACTAREAVAQVEAEITEIETKLVHIRYQKAPS